MHLLRESAELDEDTGGYSTGVLLGRLAKGSSPEAVLELLDLCMLADVTVPLDRLGAIADAFADKGRVDLVDACFEYTEKTGQPTNAFLWAAKMRAHQVANDPDGAVRTFSEVPGPTVHHLAPMIDTLIAARRYVEAVSAWEDFEEATAETDNPLLLVRVAAALSEDRRPHGAVDFILEQFARRVPFRPAMFTPLFGSLARQQAYKEALRLVEAIQSNGIALSDRNLNDFVHSFRGVYEAEVLLELAPRFNELLRGPQWARLINASLLPGDFNPVWLEVVRNASDARGGVEAGSTVVECLSPGLFSKLISICVSVADKSALRWLVHHRTTVTLDQFRSAMELPSSLGEAELARELIAEMFRRGVKPDRSTFQLAATSYSGSLSAVLQQFEARLRGSRSGNPEHLAKMFVSAVLQVYAETNQASQAHHILAKFDGWPPLTQWTHAEVALLEVARRRPSDVDDFVRALEPRLGRLPVRLHGRAAREVARTGDVVVLKELLGDTDGRRRLTRRRADLLSLADQYHRVYRDRPFFRTAPQSSAPGDDWIPEVGDELEMLRALSAPADLQRAEQLWSENPGSWSDVLPIDVCLLFVRQFPAPTDLTARVLDALTLRFPDARNRIEEAADLLDLRGGMQDVLLQRLLQPAADVTYGRAEAYIRSTVPEAPDQERALARFRATAREMSVAGRPQLLLRVVTDALSLRNDPDAIRRVFGQLSIIVTPDWQAWAHLQVAHDDDPERVRAVCAEMAAAGHPPHLRNLRLVVKALARAGRLDDAEEFVTSNESDLSTKEIASLLGQVLVVAANVDDLDRATRLRDQTWEMSEALPTGAEAALHDARVRAGLDAPVVSNAGEGVQVKLDSFVQDFAHDLHNMLGRVWMRVENAIEVLEERGDVEVALKQLTPIESSARTPIQERLDHWRTVADADAADEENCDVAEVARRVFALYRRETDSGVRFENTVKPGAATVRMSTFQLDLVLRHLVDNAVKHVKRVPASNRLIELRATEIGPETSHDGRRWVRVSVYDTGPGIPPDNRSAIYESGFTTNPERGIGRGLAIVNGVVKSAGATISVESRSEEECEAGQHSFTQFNLMVPRSIA